MKIKRFYCPVCKKFEDRRQVAYDDYSAKYFCRWCDNSVMRVTRILYKLIEAFVDYIKEKEDPEDYE